MSESRSQLRAWLCALAACTAGGAWLGACTGGTDTGNPLTDLDIGGCKAEGATAELSATRSALRVDGARYQGLACFGAQREGERVELDVHNFTGGCHVEWDAAGRVRDRGVDVVLTNPSCAVAACGSCLYDARFTLELPASSGNAADDEIALIDQPCEGEPITRGMWHVPEDGKSTLVCGFAQGADWHAGKTGTCGQENMPCRKTGGLCGGADAVEDCDDGLTCTTISEFDARCLKGCTTKDDCAVPEAMRCEDGLCVL